MASMDWHSQVSALERYDMIRKINPSSMSNAVEAEQKAFREASSKEEYERVCSEAALAAEDQDTSHVDDEPTTDADGSLGIRIGSYQNCRLFADGATSEVYRSGDIALKVIVTHHNIEPHSPQREIKILQRLRPPCISLHQAFRDQDDRLVMAFPYMPYTLAGLLQSGSLKDQQLRSIFRDVLLALRDIHGEGIIHRDLKPSAVLLKTPNGPAYLSDFGTAWAPDLSASTEPPNDKILDIGTGPYRAPEVLFGNKSYGTPVDMWALGAMLAEAAREPPTPLFESRAVHEDGNQLGLILSIFKTLGTPDKETWPEAAEFKVSPFELWTVFPRRPWTAILPDINPELRDIITMMVRFDGKRATAHEILDSSIWDSRG
ncbi:hypothetical protein NLU13_5865 [Sarocladium strictum]|uniref:cyclin-dependent kinase n=1 Tax=Sarocladium strictum TaxID=5046 RepID=A0AA39L6K2_SARSR|nr:hypothetical protein NLU13_5865 [Sarocladium strictum]